jgi:hypothetical protein
MKKVLLIIIVIAASLAYLFWPEKVIQYPAGVLAHEQPFQKNLNENKVWQIDEFNFKALAEYKIKARVLSRNTFSVGKESKISPLDLVLGWGPMSDQSVIDRIQVTQRNRWYHWKTDSYPIPMNEIMLNSANVHIIPKDNTLEKTFNNVYKGSLIELKGYLVEVRTDDGWRWVSSLKRDDTGGGSCELFWVEEVIIL